MVKMESGFKGKPKNCCRVIAPSICQKPALKINKEYLNSLGKEEFIQR
uniref:Saposin B-type domain-containing protein n=1 Tax=Meloidogyne hapla TaxID=6305 RepID=A0A1I8B478_MELHA